MKDNNRNDRLDDQANSDQDKLRGNTMNEIIRETSGDPDRNLNEVRDSDDNLRDELDSSERSARRVAHNTDQTQGMSYNPNDTSGVRSGGITDMDDQTSGGAGSNTGARKGLGSHLRPKTGTTGSDYDGQNATS